MTLPVPTVARLLSVGTILLAVSPVVAVAAPPAPIPVTAIHAYQTDLPIVRSGVGTVLPINQVDVKARIDGQVQKLAFAEGQDVKAGETIAQIDPRPYQAQVAQAEATLQKDMAQLTNARTEDARASKLSTVGAGTSQASDNAKSQVAITQAQVLADQAAVDTAKLNLAYATVQSPISGRAGLKQVNEGAVVHASDATGIVTITQIDPISVQFSMPQSQLPELLAGQSAGALDVGVDAADNAKHLADGKLTVIDSQVDSTTGMVRLKAEFQNKTRRLWPGVLVSAKVRVKTLRSVLVVPSAALQNGQNGSFVFVVKPDQSVKLATVKTGAVVGDTTEIVSGVALGDTVVLSGQSRLAEGTKVVVKMTEANPQAIAMETE